MTLLLQVRTIVKAETLFLLVIFGDLILRVYSIVYFYKLCRLHGLGVRNLFHVIHKIG